MFPSIWLPTAEQRDLRTLLLHRHQLVRLRVMTQNGLQAVALSQGLRRGSSLWSQAGQQALESLPLADYAATRRRELQEIRRELQRRIVELDRRVSEQARQRTVAIREHQGKRTRKTTRRTPETAQDGDTVQVSASNEKRRPDSH